ncbi:MAG: phage portal protein, partial [Caldisericia bacterium]|nr:phage portal protein [Caldisericia bacterium]
VSRVRLELMGSGAVVSGGSVLTGFSDGKASFSPISSLVVPSTLLSATTSAYISYGTSGVILFNEEEDDYLTAKIKEILKVQSVGGSALIKKIESEGSTYLNIYTPLSYFSEYDEFIQDKIESHNIFNKVADDEDVTIYLIETHIGSLIEYRYVNISKETGKRSYIDTVIDHLSQAVGEDDIIYSFEALTEQIVTEIKNICFNGESDYSDDNVSLLRELVVTNTINSQTFDKISNPLLALPEEALEYDMNGDAKVNLQDRVVIIRDGGMKPEQIKLESKIEQAQIHKQNIEDNIFSSLAINKTALGLTDVSQLSGEALRRMMSATIARVEEKRGEVAKGISFLYDDIEIEFSEVVMPSFDEQVTGVEKAVTAGVMSQEKGTTLVSGEDDWKKIQSEKQADDYQGFKKETEE